MIRFFNGFALVALLVLGACKENTSPVSPAAPTPLDPDTAPKVSIDRFSAEAGHLFVRDGSNGLPAANVPVDFDSGPFITQGLGPNGEIVSYYNFDVQPTTSAPIFVLFREGESTPVDGQLNIIDDIPGDVDYNDFWHVHKVTVPTDYVANTITSLEQIMAGGYAIERTTMIVNCPVVPEGSTANLRLNGGSNTLVRGWFRSMVVFYFTFEEKDLTVTLPPSGHPTVPLSPIYVMFNINPDQPGGGPASGFMTETGTLQTHNVASTLPADATYSPLWIVNILDNADFGSVSNLTTAQSATTLVSGAANVNCPIVSIQ